MSASLVGSEMCIRDRSTALPPGRHRLGSALLGVDRADGVTQLPPTQPVSYTHLTLPTICSV
eukprot:10211483-Alexandrium_andersonii.AAC.1